MMDYYYDLCKDCEYLYDCFGREMGKRIEKGETVGLYLNPSTCTSYYPEVEQ